MKRMSFTSRKSHTKKAFRMKNRWWQRIRHKNSPRWRWSLAFSRSAHYCTQESAVCNHSKVTKKNVPHEKLPQATHSARKIAEAALIAHLRPLYALLYRRLWCVQTFKSHKEKRSTWKIAGGSASCTKNRRGGLDRSPSAALRSIVPKTLARANMKQYQTELHILPVRYLNIKTSVI